MRKSNMVQFRLSDVDYRKLEKLWQDYQLSEWGDVSCTMSDVIRFAISHDYKRIHEQHEIPDNFKIVESEDFII